MSNLIGLNVANTLTVWLMVALGLALVGVTSAYLHRRAGGEG